ARGVDRDHAWQPEIPCQIRVDERRHESSGGAVDMDRDVDPLTLFELVECCADLLDRFVRAIERRAEDRDDADGVLVAEPHGLYAGEVKAVALHRYEAHVDIPVLCELLPTDLDVDAHDDVRTIGGLARFRPAPLPTALHRQRTEHRRLARPRRRTSRRALGLRGLPEAGEPLPPPPPPPARPPV